MDEEINKSKMLAIVGITCSYLTFIPGIGLLSGPIGIMCCNKALQDKEQVTGIIKALTFMAIVVGSMLTIMHYGLLLKSMST